MIKVKDSAGGNGPGQRVKPSPAGPRFVPSSSAPPADRNPRSK